MQMSFDPPGSLVPVVELTLPISKQGGCQHTSVNADVGRGEADKWQKCDRVPDPVRSPDPSARRWNTRMSRHDSHASLQAGACRAARTGRVHVTCVSGFVLGCRAEGPGPRVSAVSARLA